MKSQPQNPEYKQHANIEFRNLICACLGFRVQFWFQSSVSA